MERETGIEPATFSLGIPVSIENKEHISYWSPSWFFNFPRNPDQSRSASLIGPQTDYVTSGPPRPNRESAPGKLEQRFAAYLESLALAANHADRAEPLKAHCRGLLLPLERKSVEPMAARLAPHNARQTHQSLHHLVAASPWDDQAVLAAAFARVLGWRHWSQKGPVFPPRPESGRWAYPPPSRRPDNARGGAPHPSRAA